VIPGECCAVAPTLQGLRKSANAEPFRIVSLRALSLHITPAAPSAGRATKTMLRDIIRYFIIRAIARIIRRVIR
jgi:hypothetical protein